MSGIRPLIVVGSSCTGKSTVCRLIADGRRAHLFRLDAYWIRGCVRPVVRGEPSYERPGQYDGEAMGEDVRKAMRLFPQDPIVVEGFLALTYPSILSLDAFRVFLEIPPSTMKERRKARREASRAGNQGSLTSIERAWEANGQEEWERFGRGQAEVPGVHVIDASSTPEDVALSVLRSWDVFGHGLRRPVGAWTADHAS